MFTQYPEYWGGRGLETVSDAFPIQGQEEALRILSRRFKGNEKIEFEKAIENVARIGYNKLALSYLSARDVQTQLFDEARTRQILESASEIVSLFKRIITERFETEIPELSEACPKCHSLNIFVWGFTGDGVRYNCNVCHHKWTKPRM